MSVGAIVRGVRGAVRGAEEATTTGAQHLDDFLRMSSMEARGATSPTPDLSPRQGERAELKEHPAMSRALEEDGVLPANAATDTASELERYALDDELFNSPPVSKEDAATIPSAIEASAKGTKLDGMKAQTSNADEGLTAIGSDVQPQKVKGGGFDTAYLEDKGDGYFSMGIGLEKNLRGTGEGTVTYQGVYAWAAENGKTIVPDSGLSATNYVRKSAQVASSYLKAGKSAHVVPDPQVFAFAMKGIDTINDIDDIAELSYSLVKYKGKQAGDFTSAKADAKEFLDGFDEPSKVAKNFDRYADDYADTYKTYYNPDVEDSPQVAAQRANNLLVANMAASAKVLFGGQEKSKIARLAVSKQNANTAIEFTSDHDIKDATSFNWKKLMVPVGSTKKQLPFLEWLGKAALEGRLGKGTLPAAAGAAVATELYGEDEGELQ